ncbi:MAG: hypothetical protein AB7E72_05870 [Lysobacterales bacterium]
MPDLGGLLDQQFYGSNSANVSIFAFWQEMALRITDEGRFAAT